MGACPASALLNRVRLLDSGRAASSLICMTIQLKPEQERLIEEEIQNGHFQSAEEVLDHAFAALREKSSQPKSLVEFFRESPLVGVDLKFERSQDTGRRKIEL